MFLSHFIVNKLYRLWPERKAHQRSNSKLFVDSKVKKTYPITMCVQIKIQVINNIPFSVSHTAALVNDESEGPISVLRNF